MARRINDLDTPALLLDGPASDRNLKKAADAVRHRKSRLRPHFKNHKCVALARRQVKAGNCVGITAAKLGEAEVLVDGGIDDVLIANQVVGRRKVDRLLNLCERAQVRVAVDSLENARPIADEADRRSMSVGVLLEIDVGMGRCGVAPGASAVELAKQIAGLPGLRFDGLQAYEGHCVSIADPKERMKAASEALLPAVETRRLIESAGILAPIVSGGASATYRAAMEAGLDELQIGSYATMDWFYAGLVQGEFEIALSVLTRVISVQGDRFVLDVGVKGVGDEFGPPMLKTLPGVSIPFFKAEEHCTVRAPGHSLIVGDVVELIPSHCCTTCNFYREIVVREGEDVLDVWAIEGASRLQ